MTGVQQVGIGVRDVDAAFRWYHRHFGFDVPVFDDQARAELMVRYTGGEAQSRRALLALNMAGGGGFEIWQFKSRDPQPPAFTPELGDLGILEVRLKSQNVGALHQTLVTTIPDHLSRLHKDPDDSPVFGVTDPFGNRFRITAGKGWFREGRSRSAAKPGGSPVKGLCGGVCGVTIGVSNIDASLPLYRDVLGFTQTIYDESGVFTDLDTNRSFRRVLLHRPAAEEGAFSRLFGYSEVELLQSLDREGRKIFEGRYWGDLGFIHACFDVVDMDGLKTACEGAGFPFTVDSASSFDMGEAAGRFSYIEDPDGTLIEFVQTHKVPVLKKIGWFIDLKKRASLGALPDWMLRSMALNRVRLPEESAAGTTA